MTYGNRHPTGFWAEELHGNYTTDRGHPISPGRHKATHPGHDDHPTAQRGWTGPSRSGHLPCPEFYGSGRTQSFTNSLVFDAVADGKKARITPDASTRRSLKWISDTNRPMELIGNPAVACDQTWDLPIYNTRPTYREVLHLASQNKG